MTIGMMSGLVYLVGIVVVIYFLVYEKHHE